MSNTTGAAVELPQYRCHKVVRAAKITELRPNGNPDMPDLALGEIGGIVTLLPDWFEKHKPQVGGYYVVYEDGYASFSPAKAFEDGYAPMHPNDKGGVLTRRELRFALNYHGVDAQVGIADHQLADTFFDTVARNRGTHPSLA